MLYHLAWLTVIQLHVVTAESNTLGKKNETRTIALPYSVT